MNDHTRGRVFAPCRGAWWAYAIRPYPGTRPNTSTGRKAPTPIGKWPGTRRGARPFFACTSAGAPGGRMQYAPTRVPAPTNQQAARPPTPIGRVPEGVLGLFLRVRVPGRLEGVFDTPLPGYPHQRLNKPTGRKAPTPKHLNKPTGPQAPTNQRFTGPCGPPLRYDHIAIFPLISFSTPPKSVLSLWQIFT